MFSIKVGSHYFGMPIDSKVVFELNNSAFEDEVIPGSFTFPNNFPVTPINDLIFKHARMLDTYPKVKEVDGELYLMGNYFDKCKVIRLESSKNVYRCSVVLNGINIDIQNKTLRDIDFSRHSKSFSKINDALQWMADCNDTSKEEQAVVWPVIKNESAFEDISESSHISEYFNGTLNPWQNSTDYAPQVADTRLLDCPRYFTTPKIRLAVILECLFNQFGYSVNGSLINDNELRSLTIFSNRIFRMESGAITQASAGAYIGTYAANPYFPWHFPTLNLLSDSEKHDATDVDHYGRVDVFINNTWDIQYPHDLVKVKLLNGRINRVIIRAKMSQATTGPLQIGIFGVGLELNGTGGAITGDVAWQKTDTIAVGVDSNIFTFVHDIDLDSTEFVPNYYASVGVLPVIAPGSDLDVEWLTINIVELDYTGDDFIDTFNIADFVPNQPIDEFLSATKQAFNLSFNFDWSTNTVNIDKCVSSLQSAVEDISTRIGDDLPAKTIDVKGYEFAWDWLRAEDKLTSNNFETFSSEDFIGYVDTVFPTSPNNGVFISRVNNKAFRISINESGAVEYNVIADAWYSQITGDGSKKITPSGFSPVIMSTVGTSTFTLCPNIQTSMHYPRYGLNYNDYSAIRLSFYRGLCQKVGSSDLVPISSSMNRLNVTGASPLGNYTLTWDSERSESSYNLWWAKWELFMRSTEKVRDRIKLDMPFIQKVFKTQKRLDNTILLAGKLTFTISESGIEDGEIELYRNNYSYNPDGNN